MRKLKLKFSINSNNESRADEHPQQQQHQQAQTITLAPHDSTNRGEIIDERSVSHRPFTVDAGDCSNTKKSLWHSSNHQALSDQHQHQHGQQEENERERHTSCRCDSSSLRFFLAPTPAPPSLSSQTNGASWSIVKPFPTGTIKAEELQVAAAAQFDSRSVASSSKYSDKQMFARMGDRFVCIDSDALPTSPTPDPVRASTFMPRFMPRVGNDVGKHDRENDCSSNNNNNFNSNVSINTFPSKSIAKKHSYSYSEEATKTQPQPPPPPKKELHNNSDERFCDSGLGVDDCSLTVPQTTAAATTPMHRSIKTSFTNDSYVQLLAPLRQVFPASQTTPISPMIDVAPNSRSKFANPDMNYANSITVVKQQIARAKANFFAAPLTR